MIPYILDKNEEFVCELPRCKEAFVIEERNGIFEIELKYFIYGLGWENLQRGNIIVADANDTLRKQKFRIYNVQKNINGEINVYGRHISYDLANDMIDEITISNQSCEYVLNTIFRNSTFCNNFVGHSDIVNAQDYHIKSTYCLSAIAGEKGSILDTFGNGAEILRDNRNFHILNKRGNDNGVTIKYRINLTGLDLEEDSSDMITSIKAIAKYRSDNGKDIIVSSKPKYVNSPYVNNYETPFIKEIDFSNQFENEEIPTPEKLTQLANKYFKDNRCDMPKQNYKIQFIPLSKCVGYESLEDKIGLCDIVTIQDTRYGINTKAKVIKTVYDVLRDRYDSMELGEPKTTLGDIISNPKDTVTEEEVKDIVNNIPSTNYPNTLPNVPVVTLKAGLGVIAIDWTFESKNYYTYEVYASKTKDFVPNVFDLIFKGQASTFSHYSEPNQTWYYRVRAVNTHGNGTEFSEQKFATTGVIDADTQWIAKGAIGDAQIGTLSLDRGWVDQLKGQWIDARHLTVTDGNGLRTLDIDSFGRVKFKVTEFEILANAVTNVPTKTDVANEIKTAKTELDKSIKGISDNVVNLKKDTEEALKDNTLTDNEKRTIKANLKPLATEFAEIQKDYDAKYKNTHLTGTPKTNLKNAYDSYVLKYNNLITSINALLKLTTITEANKTTLDLAYTEHDTMLATYRTRAEEAINNIAQNKSNAAKTGAEGTAKTYTDAQIKVVEGKITSKVDQATYDENNNQVSQKFSQMTQTIDRFEYKFEHNGYDNLIINGNLANGLNHWSTWGKCSLTKVSDYVQVTASQSVETGQIGVITSDFNVVANKKYSISFYYGSHRNVNVLNYNYLMKQGGNVRLNLSWTTNTDNLNYYTATFTPNFTGNCKFMFGFNGKLESNLTGFKISKVCIVEGDTPREFIPSSRELVEGITVIDSQGLKISHEGGSFSRMDPREFYQANENGDRTMSMRFGGLRTYQFPNNGNSNAGFLGALSSTVRPSEGLYGNTIFGSSLSGYTSIGFSEQSSDNQHMGIMSWLTFTHYNGNVEPYQGIYAYKPLFIRNKLSMWGNDIERISTLRFEEGWSQIFCNGAAGSYWKMILGGETQTSMGVMTSNTNASEYFRITKNRDALMWCNLNMQNFQIKNARAIATLEAKTQKTKELTRKINTDLSAIYSTNEDEIRHSGSIFTSNGYAYVEIPSYLAENIREDYKVIIGKYGFGDYYIANKTSYGFEIISEKDIKFDYEIIATRIDDGSSYSNIIYANEQYRINEVNKTKNNEETPIEIAGSKYTVMDDEEIEKVIETEKLKENNELWKIYRK